MEDWERQKLTSRNDLTVSQNIELRNLLNECNRFARAGNLTSWRWTLDAIKRELYYDMEKLDDDISKKEDTFEYRLDEIETKISKNLKDKLNLYKLLQKKEIILRKIQEDSGKGTKRVYDDDDDD